MLKDFTPEQLQKARDEIANGREAYANDIEAGRVNFASHVTKKHMLELAQQERDNAAKIRKGERDHNFTIAQKIYYILTGESVAFLPK